MSTHRRQPLSRAALVLLALAVLSVIGCRRKDKDTGTDPAPDPFYGAPPPPVEPGVRDAIPEPSATPTTPAPVPTSAGPGAQAGSVVAGMAAGFRRCYNKGLAKDPKMAGSVKITARIGPSGEVQSAAPSSGGGLSPEVVECCVARVKTAQFAPPDGGGATIVIPVTFVAQ